MRVIFKLSANFNHLELELGRDAECMRIIRKVKGKQTFYFFVDLLRAIFKPAEPMPNRSGMEVLNSSSLCNIH